ncbi:fimbrillin family protein [uncultured Bacteroides sp.]|uniref:fimbrillin family protein n=1 Tax=uncultured Bacteroides sp. TaxID=162156 RepID=UPI00260DB9F8|nr:fimbrillin family protein [uncultured Bacteroides sp.]
MKRLFFYLSSCILLNGCQTNTPTFSDGFETCTITGNTCMNYANQPNSRSNETIIQDGSEITFSATGGLHADCITLTYQNSEWKSESAPEWTETGTEASVCAIYPSLYSPTFSLYNENNELTDILLCKKNVSYPNPVELQFEHLFAQLNFTLSPEMQDQVKTLSITPSQKIESINPSNGSITYSQDPAGTVIFEAQKDKPYSIIIPATDNLGLKLAIETNDQVIPINITPRSYSQGHAYTCLIQTESEIHGIYTADDFLAFYALYNGLTYEDRCLTDFCVTKEGITTYNLKNDIYFTEEDNKKLNDLNNRINNPITFKDIFEGNGYTIYNLNITANNSSLTYYGLFHTIDTSGRLYNLKLKDVSLSSTVNNETFFLSFLVGKNYGIVSNCHIQTCNINNNVNISSALIGVNSGYVANCSVNNLTIKGAKQGGGICGKNFKFILNSYVSQVSLNNIHSFGGICYQTESSSYMENCYSNVKISESRHAYLVYSNYIGNIMNCHYLTSSSICKPIYTSYNGDVQKIIAYTESGIPQMIERLNLWIDNNSTRYKIIKFKKWDYNASYSIFFQEQE